MDDYNRLLKLARTHISDFNYSRFKSLSNSTDSLNALKYTLVRKLWETHDSLEHTLKVYENSSWDMFFARLSLMMAVTRIKHFSSNYTNEDFIKTINLFSKVCAEIDHARPKQII